MKYTFTAAIFLSAMFLVSCGENEGGGGRVQATPPPSLTIPGSGTGTGTQASPLVSSGKVNPAHGQPGHRCDVAVGAPLPSTASLPVFDPSKVSSTVPTTAAATTTVPQVQPQPVATTAKGLNPAHGQPGHRCDIPVGQPLTSAPSKPAATQPTPTTTITPQVDNTPDTMFAKGLNPAHGKPGHRCDIAVGQPLTSAAKN